MFKQWDNLCICSNTLFLAIGSYRMLFLLTQLTKAQNRNTGKKNYLCMLFLFHHVLYMVPQCNFLIIVIIEWKETFLSNRNWFCNNYLATYSNVFLIRLGSVSMRWVKSENFHCKKNMVFYSVPCWMYTLAGIIPFKIATQICIFRTT